MGKKETLHSYFHKKSRLKETAFLYQKVFN